MRKMRKKTNLTMTERDSGRLLHFNMTNIKLDQKPQRKEKKNRNRTTRGEKHPEKKILKTKTLEKRKKTEKKEK